MLALSLAVIGSLGIAFAQMGQYGLLSGLQQLPFRGLGLLFLWFVVNSICKKNEITTIEELNGIRHFVPYTYGLMVLLAVFLIGVPGTGTFTGVMYTQMGYMYSYSGVFSYVGMLGNVVGMIIIAMIVFPMLREAFLFEKKENDSEKKASEEQKIRSRKNFVKPAKALYVVTMLVVVAMLVLSVWQGPMISVVAKIVDRIM